MTLTLDPLTCALLITLVVGVMVLGSMHGRRTR